MFSLHLHSHSWNCIKLSSGSRFQITLRSYELPPPTMLTPPPHLLPPRPLLTQIEPPNHTSAQIEVEAHHHRVQTSRRWVEAARSGCPRAIRQLPLLAFPLAEAVGMAFFLASGLSSLPRSRLKPLELHEREWRKKKKTEGWQMWGGISGITGVVGSAKMEEEEED